VGRSAGRAHWVLTGGNCCNWRFVVFSRVILARRFALVHTGPTPPRAASWDLASADGACALRAAHMVFYTVAGQYRPETPRARSTRVCLEKVAALAALAALAVLAGRPELAHAAPARTPYDLPEYNTTPQNTDPWEIWSTRPDGSGSTQDLLLVQGRLRHTVSQNNMAAFKAVLSSRGCHESTPVDARAACEALLHHGDPHGLTIYHVIGKLGLGGDYVEKGNTSHFISVKRAIQDGAIDPDTWRFSAEWPNDIMSNSLLKQIFEYSKNVLKIEPNLKLRDISGQTPMHEAALHGRVLTVRAMALITNMKIFEPEPAVPSDVIFDGAKYVTDFVRAAPLRREWAFGWTMMNFAATTARDSAMITNSKAAMKNAMESPENFALSRGMTVMDYAAINGHADVVDLLATLEARNPGQRGLDGLGFAVSNWNEAPIQKAVTLNHTSVVETFLQHYTCLLVFSPRSAGGETIFHNAVGGGQAAILKILKAKCPAQYNTRMSVPTNPVDTTRHIWGEQTPCLMSQTMIEYINKHEIGDRQDPEFPEGFVGRFACSKPPIPRVCCAARGSISGILITD